MKQLFVLLVVLAQSFLIGLSAAQTAPAPQRGMEKRHAQKVAEIKARHYDVLLLGDSITHNLEKPAYQPVWRKFFDERNAINLGYSGGRTENILWNIRNGELEGQSPRAVIVLIGTNDADDANYAVVHTPEQVAHGTAEILRELRQRCPAAKVLLLRVFPRANVYRKADGTERGSAAKRAAANLRTGELIARLADGKQVIFLDVNHVFLKPDGTIDRTLMPDLLHPSPAGTEKWLAAIEPELALCLGEKPRVPVPDNNAIVPVPKLEKDSYDWDARHAAILRLAKSRDPEVVMIGDSITHFWGGEPESPGVKARGPKSWNRLFSGTPVLNLGYGWDRTQNVIWRLDHGEFDGLHPSLVVINIGTNNFSGTKNCRASTPAETAQGIREIVLRVRAKAPTAKVVLTGVFPRGKPQDPVRTQIRSLNEILAKEWSGVKGVTFSDPGAEFLRADGTIPAELMPDGLHPSEKGYEIWEKALGPFVR